MPDLTKMSVEELCSLYTKTYYSDIGIAILAELTRRTEVPAGHVKLDDGRVVKVLGTLPMTADGCVAGKGAKLYPLHPIDLGDGDDDFATLELAFYVVPPEGGRLDEDDEAQIITCYSTSEAAEAALAAKDAERLAKELEQTRSSQ